MTAHEKMTIFLIMYGVIFIKGKEKRVDGESMLFMDKLLLHFSAVA